MAERSRVSLKHVTHRRQTTIIPLIKLLLSMELLLFIAIIGNFNFSNYSTFYREFFMFKIRFFPRRNIVA